MKNSVIFTLVASLFFYGCSKKEEPVASNTNIASQVVTNLNQVSADFAPVSMTSGTTQALVQQSTLCSGKTWEVCQSLLIREYINIGRDTVNSISEIVGMIGSALGNVSDGSSGTSSDNKVSWLRTDANNWQTIFRGTADASVAYVSVANNVYTLKLNGAAQETNPSEFKADATVTYTDASNWEVSVLFTGGTCDPTDIGSPSSVLIKMKKTNGLWQGNAMLYISRWEKPGQSVTCSTAAGTHEIAMYTEFVGNETSSKAGLYLIPATDSSFTSTANTYALNNFCTNFAGVCGQTGAPTSGAAVSGFTNPWCTTGPTADPSWGDSCSSNSAVSSASFLGDSYWLAPSVLKASTVTLPTSL